MDEQKEEIKKRVLSRFDPQNEPDEDTVLKIIDEVMTDASLGLLLSVRKKEQYRTEIFNDIKRLDILQELIDDDEVTEIMINGYEDIFIEKSGRMEKWDRHFENQKRLTDIVQRIAASSNKIINESAAIADTRLSGGYRVNVVMNPIAIEGPVITIRKFYNTPLSMERMIEINSISKEAADCLRMLVEARYNIFISGGTGSGKTTFLNALSNYIPGDQRVITIEDSAELKIMNINNLVRLEARSANIEGQNEVTIRDLIKTSLRMRPDRVVVGEVRGCEALDMLQAMNTGHDGSLSTGHANSAKDMMTRLETMVLMGVDMPLFAIRSQIASAIDIVVHLGRLRDCSRRVLSINEVCGLKDNQIVLEPLFKFVEDGTDEKNQIRGHLQRENQKLKNREKLKAAGFEDTSCI